jgi:hypothetical protein
VRAGGSGCVVCTCIGLYQSINIKHCSVALEGCFTVPVPRIPYMYVVSRSGCHVRSSGDDFDFSLLRLASLA